jgi:hypothetical protein
LWNDRVIKRYLFIILSGVRLSLLGTPATTGLLYQPQMLHDGDCGANWRNEDWHGKPKYSVENVPNGHFVQLELEPPQ